jgi:hypothetical protein
MPIEWAHTDRHSRGARGYNDILRYVAKYRRLDTFDLVLSDFGNWIDQGSNLYAPDKREAALDRAAGHQKKIPKPKLKKERDPHRPRLLPKWLRQARKRSQEI